jgi:peptidoglycan hydrolase-like protein with peptidoglycan-binding domain
MTKLGSIFPLCVLLASGCSLSEGPEIVGEKQEVVDPVTESQTVADFPAMTAPTKSVEPQPAPKVFSSDEIRRIQSRLKEVGLDPGPVDGVAGGKTRSAAQRLETGCAEIKPVLEDFASSGLRNSNKAPSRQETMTLQTSLRQAGFNPGPADGIFGNRTGSILTQLQTLCPLSQEYAASLAAQNEAVKPSATTETATRPSKAPAVANSARQEVVKTVSAQMSTPSQEEIRILQLRLRDAGFDPGPFDGVMGPQTKKALQEFQAAQRTGKIKPAIAAGINVQY